MDSISLDVEVTRGALVESVHRVHAVVADASGRTIIGAGRTDLVTHWRSCAKPFQVLPLVAEGGLEQLGWDDDALALACGSHGGEPEHVSIAAGMLATLDLEEGDLACGPHEPLAQRGVRILREAGVRPTRLHNNCSGKHAAMLARAKVRGWTHAGYEAIGHPVQQAALDTVARWAGVAPASIVCAVDGCGVPVFALPLANMAIAYARFGAASEQTDPAAARIRTAMITRPFLVGGTERFDTVLMEETQGRVLAKVGAEGVHSFAVPDLGLGAALKVEDGNPRAQWPAVLRLLQHLGVLRDPIPERLAELTARPIRNTRGAVVGEVRPVA